MATVVKTIPRQNNKIQKATVNMSKRLMISVPLTGLLRAEWTLACEGPKRAPYPYGWERFPGRT